MIFIFPTIEEARLFIASAPPSARVEISGVGMAACGATVARVAARYPGEMIILAGVAGAYGDNSEEVVEVVEEVVEELPERYQKRYVNRAHFTDLRGVTSNCVSRCEGASVTAQIENMEGAALFATCQALGVECAQIRAISNRVGEPFAQWHIEAAIEALTSELLKIARR